MEIPGGWVLPCEISQLRTEWWEMANLAKYKSGAVTRMFNHYSRKSKEDVKRGNEQIKQELTYLNYDLLTGEKADDVRNEKSQMERYQNRLAEVSHVDLANDYYYKTINVMCDWVITLPENVPEDKADLFFRKTFDFACERYGKENVISAWVHKDETTPHMHFCFMPVVKDKDGTDRLCCREVINRSELQRFHPALQKHLEKEMGQPVAILNGATAGGNLSIAELKLQDAIKELSATKAKTKVIDDLNKTMTDNIEPLTTAIMQHLKGLDTALKTKKWFGDNDKARMNAVFKEVEALSVDIDRVKWFINKAGNDIESVEKNVYKSLDDAMESINKIKEQANKEIEKRKENIKKKEENIDDEIQKRLNYELKKHEKTIENKKAEIKKLNEELTNKQQLIANMNIELWHNQEYLRQAEENRQAFTDKIQEWSRQNESKNVKSSRTTWER